MGEIAKRFGIDKGVELFFIGNDFYEKSQTIMSPIYRVGTLERFDWGFVSLLLDEGKEVSIRQATKKEMEWAKMYLAEIRKNLINA